MFLPAQAELLSTTKFMVPGGAKRCVLAVRLVLPGTGQMSGAKIGQHRRA